MKEEISKMSKKYETQYKEIMQDEDVAFYLKETAVEIILNEEQLGDFLKQCNIPKNLRSYQQVLDFIKHMSFVEYKDLPKTIKDKKTKEQINKLVDKFEKTIEDVIKGAIIPVFETHDIVPPQNSILEELSRKSGNTIQGLINRQKIIETQRESQRIQIFHRDSKKVHMKSIFEYLENYGIELEEDIPMPFEDKQKITLAFAQREFEILSIRTTMQDLEDLFGKRLEDGELPALLYRAGPVDDLGMHSKDKHSLATGIDHIYVGSKIKTDYISMTESPILLSKFLSEFNTKHTATVYPTMIDCRVVYQMLQDRLSKLECQERDGEYAYSFDGEKELLEKVLELQKDRLTDMQKQKIEQRLISIESMEKYAMREDLPIQFYDPRKEYDMIYGYSLNIVKELRRIRYELSESQNPFLVSSARGETTALSYDKRVELEGKRVSANADPAAEYLFKRAIPAAAIKIIDRMSLDIIEVVSRCDKDEYSPIAREVITGIWNGKINLSQSLKSIFDDEEKLETLKEEGDFSLEELHFIEEYYIKGVSINDYMRDTYQEYDTKSDSTKKDAVELELDKRMFSLSKLMKTEAFKSILVDNLPESKPLVEKMFGSKFKIGILGHKARSTTGYVSSRALTHKVSSDFERIRPSIDVYYDRTKIGFFKTTFQEGITKALEGVEPKSKKAIEMLKVISDTKKQIKESKKTKPKKTKTSSTKKKKTASDGPEVD